MTLFYSRGIRVEGRRVNDDASTFGVLSAARARDFIDTTKSVLDAIRATNMGQQLMSEIDGSGHVVTIYRTWTIDGGPFQGGENVRASMVIPLDKRVDGRLELSNVLDRASEDLSGRSKIKKLLGIGAVRPRFLGRKGIARLVGVSEDDLSKMEKGTLKIPPTVDAKFRAYLYDFLSPGPGSDCLIAFNHKKLNYSEGHKRHLPMSQNPLHLPLPVVLAHELVHAWRVLTGRVLYFYGWEEEAMTVGLPPFSNMRFTENRFRIEFNTTGLAIRPEYAYLGYRTDMLQGQKVGVNQDMQWQGDQQAIEPRPRDILKEALGKRRQGLGYDDDGFDD